MGIGEMMKYAPFMGGGGTSWNDLPDRPFGESDNAVLLPPTQFAFDSTFGLFAVPGYIDFMVGKTYTVNWNGVDYTTEAVPGQFNGESLVIVGNPAALGGTNNNLPFAVACLMGSIGAIPLDGSTAVNVGIAGYGIVPIPTEYENEYHLKRTITEEDNSATYGGVTGSVAMAEYVLQSGGKLFLDLTIILKSNGNREMQVIIPLVAYGKDLRGLTLSDYWFEHFDSTIDHNSLLFVCNERVTGHCIHFLCPQADDTYWA